MVYTADLSPAAFWYESSNLSIGTKHYAPKTYMVMYSFRKAGNFVQVEVGAPNITPLKHLMDDANSCKVGKLVRFQTRAPNKAADASWWINSTVYRVYGGFNSLQRRQIMDGDYNLRDRFSKRSERSGDHTPATVQPNNRPHGICVVSPKYQIA